MLHLRRERSDGHMARTITEIYHSPPIEVPWETCALCSAVTESQMYEITLTRRQVTRKWIFCSLECLRAWAAPIR